MTSAESEARATKAELEAISQEVDQCRGQNEKLTLQLGEMTGSACQNEKTLKSRNESLQKMVQLLETDLDQKNAKLAEMEQKWQNLDQEFESYKVPKCYGVYFQSQ